MVKKLTKTAVWALALAALGLYAHGTAHAAEATSSSSSQVSVTTSDQSAVVVQTDHSSTTSVGQSSNSNDSSGNSNTDSVKPSSDSGSGGSASTLSNDTKNSPAAITGQINSLSQNQNFVNTEGVQKDETSTHADPVPVMSLQTAMTLPVRSTLAQANSNPIIPTALPAAPVTDNHPNTPADGAGTMLRQLSGLLSVTVVPVVVSLTNLTVFLATALPTAASRLPMLAIMLWLSIASLFVALLRRAGFTPAPRGPTAASFFFATPVKMGLEGGNLPVLSPIFSCWSQTPKGKYQIT